jgi:hypothetical protein
MVFGIVLVALVSVAGPGYMAYETSHPVVSVIEIEGMPERMVFIAGPHHREGNVETVHELVRQINGLEPSVVLIGGDFTAEDECDLSLKDAWQDLAVPAYTILGNHDYRAGIDGGGMEGRLVWAAEFLLRAGALIPPVTTPLSLMVLQQMRWSRGWRRTV